MQHLLRMPSEGEDVTDHVSAAEHATDSDDDDFELLRTDTDESPDDLEALIELLGTGGTTD